MASQQHPSFPSRPYAASTQQPSAAAGRKAPGAFSQSHAPISKEPTQRFRRGGHASQQQPPHQLDPQQAQTAISQLSDEQREEVNEAFGLFDLDKNGLIDYHELKVSLKALGFELTKPDLVAKMQAHGIPNENYIQGPDAQNKPVPTAHLQLNQQGFQQIAAELIIARDPRDEVMRAFMLFDQESKGLITLEDLRRVAHELGEGLEEDELAAMIEEFDLEGKGGVSREEFIGICLNP